MRSTVEALEGNRVKVSVQVEAEEFEKAVEIAFTKLAREVNIPGFRRGKAPRRVLEARFGGDAMARQQALQDALPDYYADAVRELEVDVIASPEIDITDGADSGDVHFDAVVEVRPVVTITGYASLEIVVPRPNLTDADVDERIDVIRGQHAEFEAAERAAAEGDQVLVDISGKQSGEDVEGLTANDYLYEVGSRAVVAEIDENLTGAKAGDVVEFTAPHPEEGEDELEFRIVVKEVRGSVLPELTDEFAAESTEYESVTDMRERIAAQMGRARKLNATMAMQNRTGEALGALVEDDVPEALVENEVSARIQQLAQRLQMQNLDLGRYLQLTGQSPEALVEEYKAPAELAVRVDLALRAIAEAEGLEADDESVEEYVAGLARQYGIAVDEIMANFERAGQMPAVRSDIRKGKALDWVLDRVSLVDEDGVAVDRADLELDTDTDEDEEDASGDEPADGSGEEQE